MKIHGLTIVVCEGATPVGVCDVHEVHEENVHEEDVSEEDVREVRKDVREVPQNIEIKVTNWGRSRRLQIMWWSEGATAVGVSDANAVMGPKELMPDVGSTWC